MNDDSVQIKEPVIPPPKENKKSKITTYFKPT
jgi:hypothetical protein